MLRRQDKRAEVWEDTNETSFFSATKTVIQCCLGIGAVPLKFKESLLPGSGFFITFGDYIQTWSPFLLFFKFLHSFTLYSSPPLDPCFSTRGELISEMPSLRLSVFFFVFFNLLPVMGYIIHSLIVKLNGLQPSFNIFLTTCLSDRKQPNQIISMKHPHAGRLIQLNCKLEEVTF